jgi:DNA-binding PadR family transcriptional regulator
MKWTFPGPPLAHGMPPLGAGPMFAGPFGGGRGRKRRGDVRAALLLLLAAEPRNGYQLMQAIEELSGGRWRPSPGSIYPTLAQLEDEGLIKATEQEGAKLFELTDAGREHVDAHHDHAPPWEHSDEPEEYGDLRGQLKQINIAAAMVMRAGRAEQIAQAAKALADARRAIYRALAEEDDA